jgi:DNA-binding protein YbaB
MDQEDLKKALLQAQNMQEGILKVQEELSKKVIEVTSDDGYIDLVMTAEGDFHSIKINHSLLAIKYPTLKTACPALETALLNGINKATTTAADMTKNKLKNITEGLGLSD